MIICHASAGDTVSFLLEQKSHRHAQVYTGAKQQVTLLALQYSPREAALANVSTPLYVRSRGQHFLWPLGNSSVDLTLRGENRLWVRWRYAVISNLSVTLSKVPSSSVSVARRFVAVCLPNVSVWCHAGAYVEPHHGYNVSALLIDPSRERGALPPWLWFELTRGSLDMRQGSTTPVVSQASHGGSQCFHFVPSNASSIATSFSLCDDDAPYFDMQDAESTNAITLGRSYWQANTSVVQIDGWNNTITAQTSTPVQASGDSATLAWQWASVAVTVLSGLLAFGFWAMGPRLLRFDVYLWHLLHAKQTDVDVWPVHWTTTLGGLMILPLAAASLAIAWLGGVYVLDEASIPVIDGFTFDWFVASLTGYLGAQLLIGGIAMIVFEVRDAPWKRGCPYLWWWFKMHSVPMRIAWVRSLTQPTCALACSLLAIVPLAMAGGDSGEEVLCWLLIPFALILFWIHTYYSIVLLALGIASSTSKAATISIGLIELLLLGWLETAMGILFLRPVLVANSVYFGPAYVNLGMWLLLSLPIVFAAIAVMMQASRVMRLIREEGEKDINNSTPDLSRKS